MKSQKIHHLLLLLCFLMIAGCQGKVSPTDPQSSGADNAAAVNPTLDITNSTDAETGTSAHNLLLYSIFTVDLENNSIENIPLRTVTGHWNALSWLENGPCFDCLEISGFSVSPEGILLIDITIIHPFIAPNLTGFDVRGIVMFDGSRGFSETGVTMSDPELGDSALLNGNGLTALYNATTIGSGPDGLQGYQEGKLAIGTIPNATVNAYKMFISDDVLNTRNALYAGDTVTVTYEIFKPAGVFHFGYAVDINWAPPLIKPVTDPMTDFGLDANCPEPWKLNNFITNIGDGLTTDGGEIKLSIFVFDWQGKESHAAPVIECPELFDGTKEMAFKADGDGYTQFIITLTNELLADVGEYLCLVKVEDNENADAPDWLDLSAYNAVTMTVVEQMYPPIAMADFDPDAPELGEDVIFSDDGSYDPDGGLLTKYEWDWENDGTFDEEGTEVTHSWDTAGNYFVQFRVTDDEGKTDTLDKPLIISFGTVPPIAMADFDPDAPELGEDVIFSDDGSYDPDGGLLTKYEWDWENDGTFDEEGAEVTHSWDTAGTYYVQFRVTDDEGVTDTLDEPFEIFFNTVPPVAIAELQNVNFGICEPVGFYDKGSYDPDGGEIVKYEWDWDNDGVFDDEGKITQYTWDVAGTYDIQFRVTDDEGQTDILDEPLQVKRIQYKPAAIASADKLEVGRWEPITFSGEDSYDNDCDGESIVKWEWDWENDGTFDSFGMVKSHSYNEVGYHYVMLRVTDNEGSSSTLSTAIKINVIVDTWVDTWGGNSNDYAYDLVTDIDVNLWSCGVFSGTGIDFDPGEGELLKDSNGAFDSFLCKYNPQGELLWVGTWGSSTFDQANSIDYASESGGQFIYVTGSFTGTVDFDPGSSVYNRTAVGDTDAYLSKFDLNGNHIWTTSWGGNMWTHGVSVTKVVDPKGVAVCGDFYGTTEFDPGDGWWERTSHGGCDMYLSWFDTDGNFEYGWAWGGTYDDFAYGLDCDYEGCVFMTGSFEDYIDFYPGSSGHKYTSNGGSDIYIMKCKKVGDPWIWWKDEIIIGGTDDDVGTDLFIQSLDVYVTGYFGDTVDFNAGGGADNKTAGGKQDAFLTKYSLTLDYNWAQTWGSTVYSAYDAGLGLDFTAGGIHVTGAFENNENDCAVDFDPGPGYHYLTSNGSKDIFISKFYTGGSFAWASSMGSEIADYGYAIASLDTPVVCGGFQWKVDFDPDYWVEYFKESNGNFDAFMVKLDNDGGL